MCRRFAPSSCSPKKLFIKTKDSVKSLYNSWKDSKTARGSNANHPFIVWGVWYLWLASMTMIVCGLLLFFCMSVVITRLHLDEVLCVSLLSGIFMIPTNCYMLQKIAQGKKIDPKQKACGACDLWICLATIIIINLVGAAICIQKVRYSDDSIIDLLNKGMMNYKKGNSYKKLMDVLQWGMNCCGLNSYKDWFKHDWYDRTRDFEWDPTSDSKLHTKMEALVTDSVPYSCCKTGSCVANYLTELGTSSIHKRGCKITVYGIIMVALLIQSFIFASVVVIEILILCMASKGKYKKKKSRTRVYAVKNLLTVNPYFDSSATVESASEDSGAATDLDLVKEGKEPHELP